MAKNILQTKKRVSHFQKTSTDLDGENELFGCKDYVSSIIQDMDSNFSYIQSGYSKRGMECNETHFTPPEDSFLNIPLLNIPSPSSNNGTLQTPAKHTKSKKFSFSRKFPLMEKSQKILKQLKHNQNIPKPRAHLAGIPKSPAKGKTKCISPKKSVAKKKEILNVKNKVISNPHCKVPSNHSPVLNINSHLSKILKDGLVEKHSQPKKIEGNISAKDSCRDIPNIDSNKEANSVLESDSGTSDSEYERFVKKSKKGLQKKSKKGLQKKSSKRQKCKPSSRSLKREKLSHVYEQKNSYGCDDVTESSRNSKISPFKKQKVAQDDSYFENDMNCSDQDVPDVPTRDSSSESDDDSLATSETQKMISKTTEVKPVSETIILSGTNSSLSYPHLSVLESNINSNFVSSNDETQILDSVQLGVEHIAETEISSSTNLHESCRNLCILESNINSGEVQSKFLNEDLINSIKIERNNLPSNMVIDICNSDDESNNTELNASELINNENVLSTSIENSTKSSDSEESDIEIIEEVKKPVQTVVKSSASVIANAPDYLKNVATSEKHLDIENVCVDVKPLIKIENPNNKSSLNVLPVVKSQNEAEIEDVVYRTDICQTKMILQQRTIISSHCSKTQNVPSKRSFHSNPDLTVVKHEIGSDEGIIILDSVHSTKVNALNLPSAKTENIKFEPSASESKLKFLNNIDSEPKTEINEWEKKIRDVIPVSSTELLEWYKMEFETYMEMKQANADVEASLKNLQARQAQKMRYVRNLLHKCVKSNQDIYPFACEAPLPLSEPSKDSKDFISLNVQNSDITPNNSFSLNPQTVSPSNVVQDIKPDVNKLKEGMMSVAIKPKIESVQDDLNSRKCIPKIESDDKQTLKLLDEKCSVCGKDAVAACQRCAKVFFCSHECGRKFWLDGHVKVCGTK